VPQSDDPASCECREETRGSLAGVQGMEQLGRERVGSSLIVVGSWALALTTACFVPDDEALTAKVLDECNIGLAHPCADDQATVRELTRRKLVERIRTEEDQRCILEADCGPPNNGVNAITRCIPDAYDPWPAPDRECADDCFIASSRCGGPSCDVDQALACEDEQDRCVSDCRFR
jgi:hypothetical protein